MLFVTVINNAVDLGDSFLLGYTGIEMSLLLSIFIFVGLLLAHNAVGEPGSLCQISGTPEFPVLSKEGDVTIGGVFSIHSKITQPPLFFTERPTILMCTG